jgi:hypothetical protein
LQAYLAWLALAGTTSGPLFWPVNRHCQIGDDRLSDKAVARIVKRWLEAAGPDPTGYAPNQAR